MTWSRTLTKNSIEWHEHERLWIQLHDKAVSDPGGSRMPGAQDSPLSNAKWQNKRMQRLNDCYCKVATCLCVQSAIILTSHYQWNRGLDYSDYSNYMLACYFLLAGMSGMVIPVCLAMAYMLSSFFLSSSCDRFCPRRWTGKQVTVRIVQWRHGCACAT